MSIKQSKTNKKSGFTIIEVVLVLAIAGLIFLMVFVALPALQRNQRDTQRREDYSQLQAAVIAAYSNNGSLPADATSSNLSKSIGNDGKDPDNVSYSVSVATATSSYTAPSVATKGKVYVIKKAECVDDAPAYKNDTNYFVIYGYLEGGKYCRSARAR